MATIKQLTQEQKEQLLEMYKNTLIPLQQIQKFFKLWHSEGYNSMVTHCIETYGKDFFHERKSQCYALSKLGEKNPMKQATGNKHPRYVGDVEDGNGYLMRVKPPWYTGRKGSYHVFVHSLVLCEHLGITEIPKGFVVHHIDKNKKNNEIDNLCLLTIAAHARLHNLLRLEGAETIREE